MFRSSKKTRRHRTDAAAPRLRRLRDRRLSIEAMESRLLLSGNQAGGELDYSIWNLESLQSKYAIISQGDALPSSPTITSNAAGPAGADLDVSWVAVPEMLLSANDAQQLAYQQYREAQSQGIMNYQQSSALLQQWQAGLPTDAGATLVPVYTIGIRNHSITPTIGGPTNLFADSDAVGLVSNFGTTPPLVGSLGSTGSSFAVDATPIQYNYTPAGLDDDVRSSGDFNRDGLVNVADYQVFRDAGTSDIVAYTNWKSHFGQSVSDAVSSGSLGNGLPLDQLSMLDSQPTLTIDVSRTPEISAPSGPLTVGFDFALGGPDDSFVGVLPRIIKFSPNQPAGDALSTTEDTIADQGLIITIGPVTLRSADDTNVAASGAALIINVDSGSPPLVVSPVANTDATANRQSKAEEDLADAIDELLSDDAIIVSQSGDASSEPIADITPSDTRGAIDVASSDVSAEKLPDGKSRLGGSAQEATANQLAEGGMIAVDQIINAEVDDSSARPTSVQVAAGGDAAELVGELSRVAVMELIDGEPEPGESPNAADHVSLIAERGSSDAPNAEVLAAVRLVTDQASLAISLVSPVHTAFLGTVTEAASHAFAAVVNSELSVQASSAAREGFSAPDTARSEAFSQWADDESELAEAENNSHRWLDVAPLVVALACERALAAKRKRREQRDPVRPNVKAK